VAGQEQQAQPVAGHEQLAQPVAGQEQLAQPVAGQEQLAQPVAGQEQQAQLRPDNAFVARLEKRKNTPEIHHQNTPLKSHEQFADMQTDWVWYKASHNSL
jgi:hypothetical protein